MDFSLSYDWIDNPVVLARQFVAGLSNGSLLFLVAAGLSLIFGVSRIINFAHGAIYMLGAYFAYMVVGSTSKDPVTFFAAIVCYREYLHIGVGVLPAYLKEPYKSYLGWFLESCMLITNLFMVVWGFKLVATTWNQWIAELPIMSVGISYSPIVICGAVTILFIIERMLTRKFFHEPEAETVSGLTTE